MKILFVGDTRATSCSLHYFTNMVRLGHTVFPFDPQYFHTPTPWSRLAQRLRRAPSAAKRAEVHQRLVTLCRQNTFDVVMVMAETFLGTETIEEIRAVSRQRPCFLFHSHDNVFFSGILQPSDFHQTLRAYDVVFTTKSQNLPRYHAIGQANAIYVPSAYEPSVHRPIGREESTVAAGFPVTFVGTFDRSRIPYLEVLDWSMLHVWGDRWDRYAPPTGDRQRVHPSAIYYLEFADVLSHSDIALGLLREEAGDLHTQRTLEIPACGTFQIAPRNTEIQSMFEEDREIVLFDSPEELRDKVNYYLQHSTQRRTIARQGWERLRREQHTYRDRVETMLSLAVRVDRYRALG